MTLREQLLGCRSLFSGVRRAEVWCGSPYEDLHAGIGSTGGPNSRRGISTLNADSIGTVPLPIITTWNGEDLMGMGRYDSGLERGEEVSFGDAASILMWVAGCGAICSSGDVIA